MAYTLGNKFAKKFCKRIVLLQLIIENVVTCFLEHSVETFTCANTLLIVLPEINYRMLCEFEHSTLCFFLLFFWFILIMCFVYDNNNHNNDDHDNNNNNHNNN